MTDPNKVVVNFETQGGDETLRTIKQLQDELRELQKQKAGEKAAKGFDKLADSAKNAGSVIDRITRIANAFNEVTTAIGGVLAAARPAYDLLIGSNEQLNQQILASQASLAATQRVFKDGLELKDPTEAIKALGEPIEEALAGIRKESLDLVGVTSEQLVPLFQVLTSQAGKLANQSKEFPESLQAAEKLTTDFAAAFGVLQIPLEQSRQEILSILQGQISSDSQLAKSIGLNNEQVKLWQEQGVLVDRLREKLSPFVAANALAAQSIGGITSNIQEILQETARVAGEPLFDQLTTELQTVYEFLQDNQDAIGEFAKQGVDGLIQLFNSFKEVGIALQDLEPAFSELGENAPEIIAFLVDGFRSLSAAAAVAIQTIAPFINYVAQFQGVAVDFLTTARSAVGLLTGSFGDATEAVNVLNNATAQLGDESIGALDDLKKAELARQQAQQSGIALTDDQVKAEQAALQAARSQIEANEAQIASLKAVVGQSGANENAIKAQIAELENYNSALQTNVGNLSKAAGGVQLQTSELQRQQETLTQLSKAYEVSSRTIAEAEADKLLEIAKLQESGQISSEEADRQKLEATQERIASEIEAERAKLTELEKLDQNNEDIARQTSESRVRLAELETQSLQGEIKQRENSEEESRKKLERTYQESGNKIEQAEADRLKEIASLESSGAIGAEEAQKRRLQAALDRIKAEVQAERKKLQDLEALGIQGDPEDERKRQEDIAEARIQVAKKETEALTQEFETRRKIEQLEREKALKDVERSFDNATAVATAAETERLTELQQLLNQGLIREEEFNAEKLQSTRDRISAELQAEREKLSELQALPTASDPDIRESQEKEIRASIQRTADLSLQLLENERQAQQALQQVQVEAIRRTADEEIRAQQRVVTGLQDKQAALDAQTRTLERQNDLLNAQADVQQTLASFQQQQGQAQIDRTQRALEISRQLNDDQVEGARERRQLERELQSLGFNRNSTEEQILQRRQQIERQIAERNRQALEAEFALKQRILELDLRRQDIANRRAELETRIAANQAEQARLDANAQLQQAIVEGDPEAIAAAQLQVDLANQSAELAQENVAAAQEQVSSFDQIANAQRQSLEIQRQSALYQQQIADDAERQATALERAQAADRRGSSRSGVRSLRVGGNFQAGELLQVHRDEYIMPRSPGVVLSQSRSRDLAQQMLGYRAMAQNAVTRPAAIVPPIQQGGSDREVLKTLRDIKIGIEDLKKIRPTQSNQIKIEGVDRPGMTAADFLERQRRNLFRNS